jgi:hypothetical protein
MLCLVLEGYQWNTGSKVLIRSRFKTLLYAVPAPLYRREQGPPWTMTNSSSLCCCESQLIGKRQLPFMSLVPYRISHKVYTTAAPRGWQGVQLKVGCMQYQPADQFAGNKCKKVAITTSRIYTIL